MVGKLVDKFLCCFSLAAGSILTGICGMILGLVGILVLWLTTRIEFKTIVFDWLGTEAVKIILTVNLVMTIIISLAMIIGVIIRNCYCMVPFVVLGLMLAIGLIVSVIHTAVVSFIDDFVLQGFLWLILGLLACATFIYMWMVTFSHFIELKDEQTDRGRYSKQPYRR